MDRLGLQGLVCFAPKLGMAMEADANSIWAVGMFLLGFAAKAVEGWVQDIRLVRRDREARAEQRSDRWVDLQRRTLLDLQQASADLAKFAGRCHHEDVMAYRKTGAWQKQMLGEEMNEGFRSTQSLVALLAVRIHDRAVRELAATLQTTCVEMVFSPSEEATNRAYAQLSSALDQLNERIGEIFRNLDGEPPPGIASARR